MGPLTLHPVHGSVGLRFALGVAGLADASGRSASIPCLFALRISLLSRHAASVWQEIRVLLGIGPVLCPTQNQNSVGTCCIRCMAQWGSGLLWVWRAWQTPVASLAWSPLPPSHVCHGRFPDRRSARLTPALGPVPQTMGPQRPPPELP